MSSAEVRELFAPPQEQHDRLIKYFDSHGIKYSPISGNPLKAILKGKVSDFESGFGQTLHLIDGGGEEPFIGHLAPLEVPGEILGDIAYVNGLNPRYAKERRVPFKINQTEAQEDEATTEKSGYSPLDIAKAYQFPEMKGDREPVIGLIELGGSYLKSDLELFFQEEGLQIPQIVEVGIPSGNNNNLDNIEITVDIEVAGAVIAKSLDLSKKKPRKGARRGAIAGATAATFGPTLVIYYGTTMIEALRQVAFQSNQALDALSISWAGVESSYTQRELDELNQLLYLITQQGATILAASGDSGAFAGTQQLSVELPAAHPLVLGVGGTNLFLDAEGQIEGETVWNDAGGASGGGFSMYFPVPAYQRAAVASYPYRTRYTRGVPDVAASASSSHGYAVVFNGKNTSVGGTSLATPLWAGLIARLNSQLGHRLGYCNNLLYAQMGTDSFRPILYGNNRYFPAYGYWCACTGLGTPNGEALLEGISQLEAESLKSKEEKQNDEAES